MAALNAIHAKMHKALAQFGGHIDAVFFCPHAADSQCECRKPKTGLFRQIAERFHVSLGNVPAVGDSLRDLAAAAEVGARPMLVETGKGRKTLEAGGMPASTEVFANLSAVADALIGQAG
jgi:D-glycero-D-manno-heptose 1,7-bisphosphate phosphatase